MLFRSTTRTVWGTRSVASAAGAGGYSDEHDEDADFDERWSTFEEGLRGGSRRPSASPASASTGSNSGGGAATSRVIVAGGGSGRRKKKLVLSLTAGAGGRGTG